MWLHIQIINETFMLWQKVWQDKEGEEEQHHSDILSKSRYVTE